MTNPTLDYAQRQLESCRTARVAGERDALLRRLIGDGRVVVGADPFQDEGGDQWLESHPDRKFYWSPAGSWGLDRISGYLIDMRCESDLRDKYPPEGVDGIRYVTRRDDWLAWEKDVQFLYKLTRRGRPAGTQCILLSGPASVMGPLSMFASDDVALQAIWDHVIREGHCHTFLTLEDLLESVVRAEKGGAR